MAYINLDTLEYPRFQGDIDLNPSANWAEVEESEYPVINENQLAYLSEPEEINGKWKVSWLIRDLTEQEVKNRRVELVKIKVINNIALSQEEADLLVSI